MFSSSMGDGDGDVEMTEEGQATMQRLLAAMQSQGTDGDQQQEQGDEAAEDEEEGMFDDAD